MLKAPKTSALPPTALLIIVYPCREKGFHVILPFPIKNLAYSPDSIRQNHRFIISIESYIYHLVLRLSVSFNLTDVQKVYLDSIALRIAVGGGRHVDLITLIRLISLDRSALHLVTRDSID